MLQSFACCSGPILKDKREIEAILDCHAFDSLKPFLWLPGMKSDWLDALTTLMLWSVLNFPKLSLTDEVLVGSKRMPVAQVVSEHCRLLILDPVNQGEARRKEGKGTMEDGGCIGSDETGKGKEKATEDYNLEDYKPNASLVRLRIARYVIRDFLGSGSPWVSHIPFIEPLLRNPELVGPSDSMEELLRVVLAFRVSQAQRFRTGREEGQPTWAECFPFFAGSSIEKDKVPRRFESRVCRR